MATELELKLAVPSPELLEQIIFDKELTRLRQGEYRLLDMATIYYDTMDRMLAKRCWTLRLRQENERLVATVKTPAAGTERARHRNEWECEAPTIQMAIPLLVKQGAPAELTELLTGQPLIPQCAAQFTRREAELVFSDGTVCTFCGDVGTLIGGEKEQAFCEVELELKSGAFSAVETYGKELCKRFGLVEERKSKFARAAALAEVRT